jgi:serine protease Do
VNLCKTVAADLIKEGRVRRGYIGVQIKAVDQTMAEALKMSDAKGVLVEDLVDGGAAKESGVEAGDVILSVNGHEVNEANDLQLYVAEHHAGDKVDLEILRSGSTIHRSVSLRERAEDSSVAHRDVEELKPTTPDDKAASKPLALDAIGMTVRPLTPAELHDMDIKGGVRVSDIKLYGEAFNREIRKDDVILEADRKSVGSPEELKQVFDRAKPGNAILLRIRRESSKQNAFVAVQVPR